MRGFLTFLLGFSLVGCAADSRSVRVENRLGIEREALAGERAAPAVEARYGGVIRDSAAESRMERVAGRLAVSGAALGNVQYRLLDAEELNAVSLPGRVYVTRGLYDRLESDVELAAVIAHEWAHLEARDHFKPPCSSAEAALQREIMADRRTLHRLVSSAMDPHAMIVVVRLVEDAQLAGWAETRERAMRETLAASIVPHP